MADIVLIERIFPKYRKDLLDELSNHIKFKLLHANNKSGIKQVSAPYSKQIDSLSYSRNVTNTFLNVFPYILKVRPKIIIHDFSIGIASLLPTLFLARLSGIKFILWGHGYDRTKGFHPKKSIMDKLRIWLLRKTDAAILYGHEAKRELSEYVHAEKLFVALNCLNTNVLNIIRERLEVEGRDSVKKRIGFKHRYNLIYIGRILEAKKPELLIEIYSYLREKYDGILGIHYIGDGDYIDRLKDQVKLKGIENNIYFYGSVHDDDANGEMLFCSDLMVMPGFVGLSINHAFNFNCPVVSFKQKGNGPEVENVINERTGFIVEEHSVAAMAQTISNYLENKEMQDRMRMNVRHTVEHICSIDNFIDGFLSAIRHVSPSLKILDKENETY
jgi:glycosyltransferase involved in cell wall biosynthesis